MDSSDMHEVPASAETPAEAHAAVDNSEHVDVISPSPGMDGAILPVIGLGGSAGSLAALQDFFENTPTDLGVVYVVVIHLSPDYESQLANILQRKTTMPVIRVTEERVIHPNCVYVIPPGLHLTMTGGILVLSEPEQDTGKRVAVDLFFRSLAASHRSRAVAIVLSGLDCDGSVGIKRIKEAGGVTIAQDTLEAEYEEMPRSAIQTGMVDWILPVARMPQKIGEWVHNEQLIRLPPAELQENPPSEDKSETALQEILSYLFAQTGNDFSHYKRPTILRRVMRRLQVNSLVDLPQYEEFLRSHPGETAALLQDMLVSVTNFFRDPEAFIALRSHLNSLYREKESRQPLRVWVPGCATGEEPYSLMMILTEEAEAMGFRPEIQIFATDLNENALRIAREGYYPMSIAADVSPERLKRFFVLEQGRYRVKRIVRESVLFARHNLLSDAPFSKVDLISCRNLLIYFNRATQTRAMSIFHFALRSGGRLFLGGSERMEGWDLFTTLDKKHRILQPKNVPRAAIDFSVPKSANKLEPSERRLIPQEPKEPFPSMASRKAVAKLHLSLIAETAPPSILVDATGRIIHLSGEAGAFLKFGEGVMVSDLATIIHPALRLEFCTAFFRAVQKRTGEDTPPIPFELEGRKIFLSIRIRHGVADERGEASLLLVTFIETRFEDFHLAWAREESPAHFENELKRLRERQLSLSQDLGSCLEELQSRHQELQAANEEHHRAMEELETSREELQATNEELITVNQELKHNLEELSHANTDLQNFIASSDVATIFLSRDLLIKRYTEKAAGIFRIIPGDVGRPLGDLRHCFSSSDFIEEAKGVVLSQESREIEMPAMDKRHFLLRISPYRMSESEIDGVVLTFVDITASKRSQKELQDAKNSLSADLAGMTRLHELNEKLLHLTSLEVTLGNILGLALEFAGTHRGMIQLAVHDGPPRIAAHRGMSAKFIRHFKSGSGEALEGAMQQNRGRGVIENVETNAALAGTVHGKLILEEGIRSLLAIPLVSRGGKIMGMLIIANDVFGYPSEDVLKRLDFLAWMASDFIERVYAGELLRKSEARLSAIFTQAEVGLSEISIDGKFQRVNASLCRILQRSPEELLQLSVTDVTCQEDMPNTLRALNLLKSKREPVSIDKRYMRPDGTAVWANSRLSLLEVEDHHHAPMILAVTADLTERKKSENALRESREYLMRVVESVKEYAIITTDEKGVISSWNPGAAGIFGYAESEVVGKPYDILFTPEDVASRVPQKEMQTAHETGQAGDERWHLRKNGQRFWVSGVTSPLFDDHTLTGFVKVARDMTEKQLAEDAARQSEERLRVALESAGMGAWDWDLEADTVTWNERHSYLLGLDPDHARKTSDYFLGFVHPEDRQRLEDAMAEAVNRNCDCQLEFRIIRADNGEIRWMTGYGRSIKARAGHASRMTGVMYDSTDRKCTEEELRLAHSELESRVNERTQELQEALARLREEAAGRQELEEARRELLLRLVATQEEERRRISRELHDNLGQYMVALKLGLDRLQTEETTAASNKGDTYDGMRGLVDTIIKVTHRQAWELRPSELDHLGLETALEHYFTDWSQRTGIRVEFHVSGSARLESEVEIAFYRIVQEALTNVVKHASATKVEVVLVTEGNPEVTIKDDGKGFTPSDKTGRLGILGMRERLSLIGGILEITSTPGGGTTLRAVSR